MGESMENDESNEKVLALLKKNGPSATREIVEATGLSPRDARVTLVRLKREGRAEVSGMAKAARWRLPGDEREAKPASEGARSRKSGKRRPAGKLARRPHGDVETATALLRAVTGPPPGAADESLREALRGYAERMVRRAGLVQQLLAELEG